MKSPSRGEVSQSATGGDTGGRFERWSRRKRAASAGGGGIDLPGVDTFGVDSPDVDSLPADPESSAGSEAKVEPEDDALEPLLCDADMPPLDTLDGSSDVSAFFNRGVSAALRKAALRRIFALPKYNVRDGLDDYDGDYTSFEPLGDTVTCDMRFHAARHEANRMHVAMEAELEAELEGEPASRLPDPEADADAMAPSEEPSTDDERRVDPDEDGVRDEVGETSRETVAETLQDTDVAVDSKRGECT